VSGARRLLLVVALAAIAVVPLRAFGVVGGDEAGGLGVQASLGGCGVSGSEIVCEIQVAFTGVEGADHYTATVTRADGSVQDAGTVGTGEGGGSATIYVPYVGSGTYSVTVSAWGSEGDDEPELLERGRSGAGGDRDGGRASAEAAEPEVADAEPVAPPESTETSPEVSEPVAPETQTLPECQPEEQAAVAAEPAAETADAEASAEASAAPAEPPPAPAIECATPSSDANGPCCPPGA
jgi:hypothetical protein